MDRINLWAYRILLSGAIFLNFGLLYNLLWIVWYAFREFESVHLMTCIYLVNLCFWFRFHCWMCGKWR